MLAYISNIRGVRFHSVSSSFSCTFVIFFIARVGVAKIGIRIQLCALDEGLDEIRLVKVLDNEIKNVNMFRLLHIFYSIFVSRAVQEPRHSQTLTTLEQPSSPFINKKSNEKLFALLHGRRFPPYYPLFNIHDDIFISCRYVLPSIWGVLCLKEATLSLTKRRDGC